ncbi:MAG: hypothetical protein HFF17_04660 [Oscillospiraceae bacterium]|nr:hypothetical protein [Oscillospiraceae bacterium]
MRSRASFFNGALYRKNLTRFAPLWIAYLLLLLVLLPMRVLSRANVAYQYEAADVVVQVLQMALNEGCLLNLLYACALAMCFHGWMYRARSVNALAALPIRRETFFGTNLLSALTASLLPNLLAALLTWGAAAALGLPGFQAAAQWLGLMSMEFLFFYGAAVLCAALVGQLLALPGLYTLVNFAVVVVNYVVVRILETFVYGLPDNGHTILAKFSPAFYIIGRVSDYAAFYEATPYESAGVVTISGGAVNAAGLPWRYWRYFLILTAVGVLLLAAAFLLIRRRRMERAGSLTVFRPMRPVLKYCFTTGCALVLGVLAADVFFGSGGMPRLWVLVLCMLAGGFVGYFTAEILFQKSFRVFRREWIGFGVFAACLLLCVGLMEFDVFGYERRIPDAADVESVTVSGSGFRESGVVTDAAHIADLITLHQSLIDEKADQEALARRWEARDWGAERLDYAVVELVYQLRDGGTLSRRYTICCTDRLWLDSASLARRYADLLRDPYYIQLGSTPSFELDAGKVGYSELSRYDLELDTWRYETLDAAEAYALYRDCVVPDLREGLVGYTAPFYFEDRDDVEYAADLSLTFQLTVEKPAEEGIERVVINTFNLNLQPTVGSRTAARLEQLGYALCLQSERRAALEAQTAAAPAARDIPIG